MYVDVVHALLYTRIRAQLTTASISAADDTPRNRASREAGDGVRGDHQAARGAAEPEGQARGQERPIQVGSVTNWLCVTVAVYVSRVSALVSGGT